MAAKRAGKRSTAVCIPDCLPAGPAGFSVRHNTGSAGRGGFVLEDPGARRACLSLQLRAAAGPKVCTRLCTEELCENRKVAMALQFPAQKIAGEVKHGQVVPFDCAPTGSIRFIPIVICKWQIRVVLY
ncbi:uncharacterized protein LOC132332925 isoform X6 [Haemorhous mexicanus]|uniref:uncharacterized protein LOC132332925 isoform X6 n=1 Tax=Haemorhous mexicanus TaxID=30427 RepID=UPI0028BD1CDC|nr:uncharacterized protein LOC132332925 isoform X6 [Haemorhous mexicanus]